MSKNDMVMGEPADVEGATFMGEPNFQHSIDWYRQGISKHWQKICDLREQLDKAQAMLRIYESFPGYLIDHCEGDTIYEESLQHWLADHIKSLPTGANPSIDHPVDPTEKVEYELAGYEGTSGLYYSKLAAVANGEQRIEPIYRVKK